MAFPSFLVLKIWLILIKKGEFKKSRVERPQRDIQDPLGAVTFDPSGNSISWKTPEGYGEG
jgi:hypothetical protein